MYETVSGDQGLHVMSFYADSFDHTEDMMQILKSTFGEITYATVYVLLLLVVVFDSSDAMATSYHNSPY